jgi:NAD(P)-dependent dehydrogenase (short-subunit alcohol dehydrogenase family)
VNSIDLNHKRAIITGAAGGIGIGVAERLTASGAVVSLWDIDLARIRSVRYDRRILRDAHVAAVDVADLNAVEAATQDVVQSLGGIDILVNCAGIVGPNLSLETYPPDAWDNVLKVSLYGTFNCCRAVVPVMRQGEYGRIVNFASMAGKDGNPNASAYSAAKAGVIALTKSLGKELATTGICVNAVAPAVIRTDMADAVSPEQLKYMLAKIPMSRMGTVEEVAAMVAWLTSSECSFSTGAVFDLSGGRATY